MKFRPPILAALLALPFLMAGPAVHADGVYPSQPIRIISPHDPGSTTETFARLLTTDMSVALGQPIVIESHAGAAGTIGANDVARAKPDGYTGLINASIQVMYPGMYKRLPFDTLRDFTPVGVFGFAPMVVVVGPGSKIKTFKDMIDFARANPGKLSFASGGLGSLPHLVGEVVNERSQVRMQHIPYNGTGRALTDVMGHHVDILYASVASVAEQIKGGKLRALAVTSARRVDLLPDVPTIAESGLPDFDVTSWYALWMPGNTPKPIVERVNAAMREVSARPAVQERLRQNGIIPSTLTAEQFAAFCVSESARWLDVMKRAKIEPN